MNKIVYIVSMICMIGILSCGNQTSTSLSPVEFKEKIHTTEGVVVLDVRSPNEYKMNHIKNAVNLNINSDHFMEEAEKLNKEKSVLIYCKSGSRSGRAKSELEQLGFDVYELDGGIVGWHEMKYPLEASKIEVVGSYTMEEYNKVVKSSNLVLVDFYADWCGPCKMMAPHIEKLRNEHGDKLTILKVNTDESMEISRYFNITGIPLVKVYSQGEEVYDETRYHSYEELSSLLQTYL